MLLLEATRPPKRPGRPGRTVAPPPDKTVRAVEQTVADLPDDPEGVGSELGINPDLLAIQIDRNLGARVWNGTTYEDRLARAVSTAKRTLLDEIEKSLMGQESYDDFERRMLARMGVGPMELDTGGAAMRALDTFTDSEVRLAWGEGLVRVNAQEDTVLVWRAELRSSTTPGCWNNHGRTAAELGADAVLPRHWRCRCEWLTVPNPDSENAEWAALGQSILDDMAEERDSGWADMMEAWYPPPPPSRFARFRALAAGEGAEDNGRGYQGGNGGGGSIPFECGPPGG